MVTGNEVNASFCRNIWSSLSVSTHTLEKQKNNDSEKFRAANFSRGQYIFAFEKFKGHMRH